VAVKRIGILGSRQLACRIMEWISTQPDIDVVGCVVPQFEAWWQDDVGNTAQRLGFPLSSLEQIASKSPDVIFSINYWRLIPVDMIRSTPGGIVNIHHSYDLRLRGRYSTSWAIIRARKDDYWQHGTTLHYIDEELDRGQIIESRACTIEPDDTAETLFARVEDLAFGLFRDRFWDILEGNCETYRPPEPSFFYGCDSNANLEMSWDWSPEEVYDFVRAWTFKDRPRPYFTLQGRRLLVEFAGLPAGKE